MRPGCSPAFSMSGLIKSFIRYRIFFVCYRTFLSGIEDSLFSIVDLLRSIKDCLGDIVYFECRNEDFFSSDEDLF